MSGDNPRSANVELPVLGVTDLGDQAILLPLAVCIALILALSGWRRGALAWTAAIGGTLGLVLFFGSSGIRVGSFGGS